MIDAAVDAHVDLIGVIAERAVVVDALMEEYERRVCEARGATGRTLDS